MSFSKKSKYLMAAFVAAVGISGVPSALANEQVFEVLNDPELGEVSTARAKPEKCRVEWSASSTNNSMVEVIRKHDLKMPEPIETRLTIDYSAGTISFETVKGTSPHDNIVPKQEQPFSDALQNESLQYVVKKSAAYLPASCVKKGHHHF